MPKLSSSLSAFTLSNPGGSLFLRIAGLVTLLGVLGSAPGCSIPPASAPWNDDQKILPSERRGFSGRLVVETEVVPGVVESPRELHAPFFIYDGQGRYLDRVPNGDSAQIRLAPGRYVIVSQVFTTFKKVQVEIRNGETTFITLKDFREAPPLQ